MYIQFKAALKAYREAAEDYAADPSEAVYSDLLNARWAFEDLCNTANVAKLLADIEIHLDDWNSHPMYAAVELERQRLVWELERKDKEIARLTSCLPTQEERRVIQYMLDSIHAPRDYQHDEREERTVRTWLDRSGTLLPRCSRCHNMGWTCDPSAPLWSQDRVLKKCPDCNGAP